MNKTTWPCGTKRSTDNAFTGVGLPEREDSRPINCKRGRAIDLTPRRSGIVITPPGYAPAKRILRGSL